MQSGLTRATSRLPPVAEVGYRSSEQEVRAVRYVQHRGRERRRNLRPLSNDASVRVEDLRAAATLDVTPAVP